MANPDPETLYTSTSGFDEKLNQTTVHDTSIYDPAASDDQIVTLYETPADAAAARDAVVAAGIPQAAVKLIERQASELEAGVDYERQDGGLWGAIRSFFVGDDSHAHGYAEGVRRGHAMLMVSPPPGMRLAAVHALESANPIDFDARLEEWRSAGWDNLHAQQAQAAATSGGTATVYDTTTRTSHAQPVGGPAATGTDGSGSHPVDYPTLTNTTTGKP